MSKKFSIVTTIDLNELRKQIENYKIETGEMNPYIFMNSDTIKPISKVFGGSVEAFCHSGLWFEDNRIFVHNDLKFGEVEIR